jgi:hypothetical protein
LDSHTTNGSTLKSGIHNAGLLEMAASVVREARRALPLITADPVFHGVVTIRRKLSYPVEERCPAELFTRVLCGNSDAKAQQAASVGKRKNCPGDVTFFVRAGAARFRFEYASG